MRLGLRKCWREGKGKSKALIYKMKQTNTHWRREDERTGRKRGMEQVQTGEKKG